MLRGTQLDILRIDRLVLRPHGLPAGQHGREGASTARMGRGREGSKRLASTKWQESMFPVWMRFAPPIVQ
jgi:hypothetical protein